MFRLKQIVITKLLALLMLTGGIRLALAEVVPVVSAQAPVTSLTSNQLADIFLGKAEELPNGTVVFAVDQSEQSKEKEEFYRRYLNRSAAQMRAYWAKQIFTGRGEPPKNIAGLEQSKQFIASHPGSIGYMERDKVDASLKIVPLDK